jgi:hypothetical protein
MHARSWCNAVCSLWCASGYVLVAYHLLSFSAEACLLLLLPPLLLLLPPLLLLCWQISEYYPMSGEVRRNRRRDLRLGRLAWLSSGATQQHCAEH